MSSNLPHSQASLLPQGYAISVGAGLPANSGFIEHISARKQRISIAPRTTLNQ
jgi:hypothetical protein